MPDGTRYDGRYRLAGDLEVAKVDKHDIDDPAAMAQFYKVSLEDYLQGQKWAEENLPKYRPFG